MNIRTHTWSSGVLVVSLMGSSLTSANPIENSVFGTVGEQVGIDPMLLYSVALAESAHGDKSGVSPHPFALRVASLPGQYPDSREEAERQLTELLQSHRSIDVGMLQINLHWHGHRVDDPTDLLDVRTNLEVGAEILQEAMNSTDDPLIGIGRYYTYSDDNASRRYGERVTHFYRQLQQQF
ncbi:transglycosylase SLT domain-containing protein [Vreelandella massiliensis]|uniref:transglycosylase SLT domain-containing protein n=1 Tax=Vreelandella massiliensis TaxID=1816686 RepID=UPI0009F9126A|nr:transglycosylase SLT domain-containing protein [Halomonas massiliensis]